MAKTIYSVSCNLSSYIQTMSDPTTGALWYTVYISYPGNMILTGTNGKSVTFAGKQITRTEATGEERVKDCDITFSFSIVDASKINVKIRNDHTGDMLVAEGDVSIGGQEGSTTSSLSGGDIPLAIVTEAVVEVEWVTPPESESQSEVESLPISYWWHSGVSREYPKQYWAFAKIGVNGGTVSCVQLEGNKIPIMSEFELATEENRQKQYLPFSEISVSGGTVSLKNIERDAVPLLTTEKVYSDH